MTDKPKRPRDANQLAHMIVGLATGEVVESKERNSQQKSAGAEGGRKRASSLSAEERSKIAKAAAKARWEAHSARAEED